MKVADVNLIDRLDNLIFPIGKGVFNNEVCINFELYGTAFLIGSQYFALTACHVIENIQSNIQEDKGEYICGIFKNSKNIRYACCVDYNQKFPPFESHPTQDVSIIKIAFNDEIKVSPLFIIENNFRLPAADYYSMGYPEHLKFDNNFKIKTSNGTLIPDEINVITKGYIRRLVKYQLPSLKGSNFLELSEVGTPGYSGAPIVSQYPTTLGIVKDNTLKKQIICHRLLGIYIGEVSSEIENNKLYYGYATNVEAFADWKPKMLNGKSIREIMNVSFEI